ncbi:MAG: histidine phosphatase family protein [Williamsia herbipolensis]|uniref:SixA phosphatase family protein n=1 Tax=uncultured Williamsia sp. TaxID=259311 RepID=UPI0019E510AD|nr:histidine phosphatase family protein [uncultured Williamsia sp.]MBE7159742.1 histidine phosphatase family protein [Williamsia herbipolensis]
MTRTLVLMRHGKSGYPDGVSDHDRPLADRGRREAALAGDWMRRDGIVADAVVCSTATRTRQTLDRTGVEASSVAFVDDVYGGMPEDVLAAVRSHVPADASTVLVVGHEPGMPMTARALDPSAEIGHFPTSAYAVLSVTAPWDRVGLSADDPATFQGLFIPR